MERKRGKLGQGTIEFIVIFGAAILFFIVFSTVLQMENSERTGQKETVFLQSVTLDIRDEIMLAAESSEGYFREFYVPKNIFGKEYDINFTESYVYCFMGKQSFSYKIVNVTGEVKKGINNISKENGTIFIN